MPKLCTRIALVLALIVHAGCGDDGPDGGISTGDFPIRGPAEVGELGAVTLTADVSGIIAPPYVLTWSQREGPAATLDAVEGESLTFRAPKVVDRATLVIEAVVRRDDVELGRAEVVLDVVERETIVYVEERFGEDDMRAARLLRRHAEDAAPVLLDELPLDYGVYIYRPMISPDRRWVAYVKQTRMGEEYVGHPCIASMDGALVVDLLAEQGAASGWDVTWAGDASGVYFQTDDGVMRFAPAPTSGSHVPTVGLGQGNGYGHEVAPTGAHVFFSADDGLYLAGTTAPAIRISPELEGEDAYIARARWSPDGEHVAFAGDPEGDGLDALYVTSVQAGSPRVVSGALSPDSFSGAIEDVEWSPDGHHLAFAGSTGPGAFEVFVVDIRDADPGAGRRNVSRASVTPGVTPTLTRVEFSPDGAQLAFSGRLSGPTSELFVVDVLESDPPSTLRVISGEIVAGGSVSPQPGSVNTPFRWSSDSARVVFSGDLRVVDDYELFVASSDGSGTARPIFDYDTAMFVYCSVHRAESLDFDATGRYALTRCRASGAEAHHLWAIDLDDDPAAPINLATDALYTSAFARAPGGEAIVFTASTSSASAPRDVLYRTSIGAMHPPIPLSESAGDTHVSGFALGGPGGTIARSGSGD